MQLLRYVSACSVGRKTYYPKCTLCSVAERKRHIVYVKLLQEEKGGKEREKEAGRGGGTFYVTARAPPPPPGETGRPARQG